jgi:8-oxo-dGTP diphosphatase
VSTTPWPVSDPPREVMAARAALVERMLALLDGDDDDVAAAAALSDTLRDRAALDEALITDGLDAVVAAARARRAPLADVATTRARVRAAWPPPLPVVGAALVRLAPSGPQLLAAQRPLHKADGGAWELPGGKLEAGERPEQALARELAEELGLTVEVGPRLDGLTWVGSRRIHLEVYGVVAPAAEPVALEHAALRWLGPDALGEVGWAPADVPLLPAVHAWMLGGCR